MIRYHPTKFAAAAVKLEVEDPRILIKMQPKKVATLLPLLTQESHRQAGSSKYWSKELLACEERGAGTSSDVEKIQVWLKKHFLLCASAPFSSIF